jgi:transmembrane sensor
MRERRPADHVAARASDARIERQWAAVEQAGLPGPARGRRYRLPALAAGAVLFAVLAWSLAWSLGALRPAGRAALPASALLESAQAPVAMQLDDGSRVQLAPRTQLRLLSNRAKRVQLELREGLARFHVTHDRDRSFVIDAGPVQVRVVGTRFELERRSRAEGGMSVRVAVTEGVVEVRRRDSTTAPGEVRRLAAGETWSAVMGASIPQAAKPAPRAAAAPEPSEPEDSRASPEPEVADEVEVLEAKAEPAATAGPVPSPERSAARIFKRANLARRAGRMKDAADGYAELLARFPRDGRAGLCAFELGRIRMDALGDTAGAIQALERAAAAGGGSSFHEDALARIVVANDALGRSDACRSARDRYLAGYPQGVHAHALATRCK